jgi:small conductance mechanosensitive channel
MPNLEELEQLLQELSNSMNAISFNRLFWAIVVLLGGYWLARIVHHLVGRRLRQANQTEQMINLSKTLIYLVILLASLVLAFNILRVPTTITIVVMLMVWGFFLLILQPSLKDLSAGMFFHLYKPFSIGDLIEAVGKLGYVEEIGLNFIVLRALDQKMLTLPNEHVKSSAIVNYSRSAKMRVDMAFYISYQDNLREAKRILQSVCGQDPRILSDPAPEIYVSALDNRGVKLDVQPHVNGADYLQVAYELPEKVKLAFDQAGITIPVSQHNVHIHTEEEILNISVNEIPRLEKQEIKKGT